MKAFFFTVLSVFTFTVLLTPTSAQAEYLQMSVKIERYTASTGEINISSYMENVAHYVGFRLVAIEVIAGALNEKATMTVHIRNKRQGKTLQLGQFVSNYRVIPSTGYYIGRGAEEIKIRTNKPAYVKYVNLILTR